jgi:hypothetical protein
VTHWPQLQHWLSLEQLAPAPRQLLLPPELELSPEQPMEKTLTAIIAKIIIEMNKEHKNRISFDIEEILSRIYFFPKKLTSSCISSFIR